MNVTDITILTGCGPDWLFIEIDKPHPDKPGRKACLEMSTPAGQGENYVQNNFPHIKYQIINT